MPPTRVISSASKRMRGPRPYPRRRRASSAATSDDSTGSPAGRPSTMTTRARPCDSPAVRKRSTEPRYRTPEQRQERRGSAVEGVLAAAVVGDVEDLRQLGDLFEQCGLDPLAQRHLRHGTALAAAGEAEIGGPVVLVQCDEVGAPTVTGDGRVDRLLEHGDDTSGQRSVDPLCEDL